VDGDGCNAAAADDKDFAHGDFSFDFFIYKR